MATLTVRDIDESVMKRLRSDAKRERRSLNSQILSMLDRAGLPSTERPRFDIPEELIARAQRAAWAELAGKWVGEFPPIERTFGREVEL